jgi:hypothetical protein
MSARFQCYPYVKSNQVQVFLFIMHSDALSLLLFIVANSVVRPEFLLTVQYM